MKIKFSYFIKVTRKRSSYFEYNGKITRKIMWGKTKQYKYDFEV